MEKIFQKPNNVELITDIKKYSKVLIKYPMLRLCTADYGYQIHRLIYKLLEGLLLQKDINCIPVYTTLETDIKHAVWGGYGISRNIKYKLLITAMEQIPILWPLEYTQHNKSLIPFSTFIDAAIEKNRGNFLIVSSIQCDSELLSIENLKVIINYLSDLVKGRNISVLLFYIGKYSLFKENILVPPVEYWHYVDPDYMVDVLLRSEIH